MKSSKKIIIYTSILSGVFLVLTFVESLNISYEWFEISWLTNTFLLTIFGGVFTSSFVVFLCEIHNYNIQKRNAEDLLYNFAVLLYAKIIILQQTFKNVLIKPKEIVIDGILRKPQQESLIFLDNLCNVDYMPFYRKDLLYVKFCEFREESQDIREIINDCIYFDLAISEEKLKNAKKQIAGNITGKVIKIKRISLILKQKLERTKEKCDEFLQAIDYSKRYGWLERSKKITDESLDKHKGMSLNEYINKNKN